MYMRDKHCVQNSSVLCTGDVSFVYMRGKLCLQERSALCTGEVSFLCFVYRRVMICVLESSALCRVKSALCTVYVRFVYRRGKLCLQ